MGALARDVEENSVTLNGARSVDVGLLSRLMAPRDVWENLGYGHAPSAFLLGVSMRRGMQGLIIRRRGEAIGLYLVYGPYGPRMELEFDGAISDPALRRQGLALQAMERFLAYMFEGRCERLNAVIHVGNAPSRALLQRVGFVEEEGPVLPGRHGGPPRQTVMASMDRRTYWRR